MKSVEDLRQEHCILRARLHELVEFVNGTEYFTLNETRRKVYTNLKIATELHLRCLSILIYEDLDVPAINIPDFSWIGTITGLFAPSFNLPKTELKESDFEYRENSNE